jgi:hypothetical protein
MRTLLHAFLAILLLAPLCALASETVAQPQAEAAATTAPDQPDAANAQAPRAAQPAEAEAEDDGTEIDYEYMAAVERRARLNGVSVQWIHPPLKRDNRRYNRWR